MHISSLPGGFGIGEIGDAACHFIDRLAEGGLRVWQFLPLGPTGYGDSPYQSLSSFAGNELLIDVAALVRDGYVSKSDTAPLSVLTEDSIEFGELIPRKNALLNRAADRFQNRANAAVSARHDAFLDAVDDAWLHNYALFRVLKSHHGGKAWRDWPVRFRRRQPAALQKFAARYAVEIERVKVMQFLFHDQWQRLQGYAEEQGILLFGDVPIYIPFDSADVWLADDLLELDADGHPERVAGVPPDYFSETGQLWGNPLYAWARHAETGFAWWIGRMRHAVTMADLVRIDHFRGFESFWAVPGGAPDAANGQWVPGPGDALFYALQSALGPLPLVAEDLGEITPAVIALRDRHRLPGMRVLQFEVTEADFDVTSIPAHCVCYTGTHDNDTVRGWFATAGKGRQRGAKRPEVQKHILAACEGKPASIHFDMIRLAFSASARIAIAPLQDFLGLGSKARLNTPGSARGNWQWRMHPGALDAQVCEHMLRLVEGSGRGQ